MKTCRHCHKSFSASHHCDSANAWIDYDDVGSFLLSAAISVVTGDAIKGALLGGDLLGGIIGSFFDGD